MIGVDQFNPPFILYTILLVVDSDTATNTSNSILYASETIKLLVGWFVMEVHVVKFVDVYILFVDKFLSLHNTYLKYFDIYIISFQFAVMGKVDAVKETPKLETDDEYTS